MSKVLEKRQIVKVAEKLFHSKPLCQKRILLICVLFLLFEEKVWSMCTGGEGGGGEREREGVGRDEGRERKGRRK